ncbi:hypothetical protein FRAHR75_370019 [Frankia sp. Hr75.2]|nr:hypothetical protein FRAHR75_370019 [Frankia sp. Hr75.2]
MGQDAGDSAAAPPSRRALLSATELFWALELFSVPALPSAVGSCAAAGEALTGIRVLRGAAAAPASRTVSTPRS